MGSDEQVLPATHFLMNMKLMLDRTAQLASDNYLTKISVT